MTRTAASFKEGFLETNGMKEGQFRQPIFIHLCFHKKLDEKFLRYELKEKTIKLIFNSGLKN